MIQSPSPSKGGATQTKPTVRWAKLDHIFLTTNYQLPTTNYQLPITNPLTRADLESSRLHQMISQSGLGMQLLSESKLQESIRVTLKAHKPNRDVWLCAYGSLIWNPAFKFIERRVGSIYGWHRRFCLRAPVGRGTPEHHVLVLGLDCEGSCRGVVYRIAAADVESELLLVY